MILPNIVIRCDEGVNFHQIATAVAKKRIINGANACVLSTKNEYPSFQLLGVNKSKLNHIPNGINEKDYLFKGDDFIKEKLGLGNNPFILFIICGTCS